MFDVSTKPGAGQVSVNTNGVLGHYPSASDHWNNGGMARSRTDNLKHNRQTSTYHGIEKRSDSDASGSGESRYDQPRPDNGAHRTYWDQNQPGFQGGPWPSWRPAANQPNQPGPSNAGAHAPAQTHTPPGSPDADMPDASNTQQTHTPPDTPDNDRPTKRPRL